MHSIRTARSWLVAIQAAGRHIFAWTLKLSVFCFDAVWLLLSGWPAAGRGIAVIALAVAAFISSLVTDDDRLCLQTNIRRHFSAVVTNTTFHLLTEGDGPLVGQLSRGMT